MAGERVTRDNSKGDSNEKDFTSLFAVVMAFLFIFTCCALTVVCCYVRSMRKIVRMMVSERVARDLEAGSS